MNPAIASILLVSLLHLCSAQVLPDTCTLFTTARTPFRTVVGINPGASPLGTFTFKLALRQVCNQIVFSRVTVSVSHLTAHFAQANFNSRTSSAGASFRITEDGWVLRLEVVPNSRPRSMFIYEGFIVVRPDRVAAVGANLPALYDWEGVELIRAEQSDFAGTLTTVRISRAVNGTVESARLRLT